MTNSYVYQFELANLDSGRFPNKTVIMSSLDIIACQDLDGNQIKNYLIKAAINDVKKNYNIDVTIENILFHFVALVKTV